MDEFYMKTGISGTGSDCICK